MIRKLSYLFITSLILLSVAFAGLFPTQTLAASSCTSNGNFLGLPHWYEGLQRPDCSISITDPVQIWTIVLNILDILLRLSGLLAVFFIIIGGVRYIISQGESSGITAAKQTIVRAIVGLVLAIAAVVILNFVINIFGLHSSGDKYKVSAVTSQRSS